MTNGSATDGINPTLTFVPRWLHAGVDVPLILNHVVSAAVAFGGWWSLIGIVKEHRPTRGLAWMQFARQALEPAMQIIREASLRAAALRCVRSVSVHAGVGWAWLTAQLILPRKLHDSWMQHTLITVLQAQNTCKHKNALLFTSKIWRKGWNWTEVEVSLKLAFHFHKCHRWNTLVGINDGIWRNIKMFLLTRFGL